MDFFYKLPPKISTLSAVAVGYLLLDDATSNEQNAIGNWLMLAAQVICTNAYFKQLQTSTKEDNKSFNYDRKDTIKMMEKMVNALNKEIENLKNNIY